jgi:hypothetical protein
VSSAQCGASDKVRITHYPTNDRTIALGARHCPCIVKLGEQPKVGGVLCGKRRIFMTEPRMRASARI